MRRIAPLLAVLLLATCSPNSPGSAIVMPEGVRQHGYVMEVEVTGEGGYLLTVDFARFLTGDEAREAAVADGFIASGDTLPGGYYIVNGGVESEEMPVDVDAPVALKVCLDDGECGVEVEVSVDLWVDLMNGVVPDGQLDGAKWYVGGNLPYLLILDGETIVGVQEQQLP